MKIGDQVWIRVGLERRPVQGKLVEVDSSLGHAIVRVGITKHLRHLKHVDAKRPWSQRDGNRKAK